MKQVLRYSINEFLKLAKDTQNTQYVYHFKSDNFKGDVIYPLSKLKNVFPKIYQQEVDKYKEDGIEKELQEDIKELNCKWEDVVNLSTINPIILLEIIKKLNMKTDSIEVFKIPIEKLKNIPICLFTYDEKDHEIYKTLTINEYKELENIPIKTIEHYLECQKDKQSPLIFEYIPHILACGSINVEDAEILNYHS